jgi:type II secretory pathway component PulC
MWTVCLDNIEFEVRYIIGIEGLKTQIQKVVADDVVLEWHGDRIFIAKWSTISTYHNETLYNPDFPRNLAKVVTVK